jgi:hypothetical protein
LNECIYQLFNRAAELMLFTIGGQLQNRQHQGLESGTAILIIIPLCRAPTRSYSMALHPSAIGFRETILPAGVPGQFFPAARIMSNPVHPFLGDGEIKPQSRRTPFPRLGNL